MYEVCLYIINIEFEACFKYNFMWCFMICYKKLAYYWHSAKYNTSAAWSSLKSIIYTQWKYKFEMSYF